MITPTGKLVRAPQVLNSMGTSTIAAPSQQAVTERFGQYQPKGNYAPAGDYATNTALNNGLATKLNTSNVAQSTGTSTTNVMSQKAVSDKLNSIESSHGLGYGQNWVDVTNQRSTDATYVNSTGKPIMVAVSFQWGDEANKDTRTDFYVGSVIVARVFSTNTAQRVYVSFIVPPGSSYKQIGYAGTHWAELR